MLEQTQTPAFKEWFGDSKVVDAQGQPLVVYHGTKQDIRTFVVPGGNATPGLFFTTNPEYAAAYAGAKEGSNITPVFVRLENPWRPENWNSFLDANERARLISEGYDGIIAKSGGNGVDTTQIVAFHSEQVKSAIGNRGTFDSARANISSSRLRRQRSRNGSRAARSSMPMASRCASSGTTQAFDTFDPSMRSGKTGNPNAQLGYFFSNSPAEASRYAKDWGTQGGNVVPAYLSIKDPYRMSYKEFDDLAMGAYRSLTTDPEYDGGKQVKFGDMEGQRKAAALVAKHEGVAREKARAKREELIKEGYDGIVVKIGGGFEYIAFDPEQIKSAIGARGGVLYQGTNPSYDLQAEALTETLHQDGNIVKDVLQVDQLIDSAGVPTITLQDMVGMSIFPTIADRTAAGGVYAGIDSSQLHLAVPLYGGPLYPLLSTSQAAGVAWTNRGKGVTSQKAAKLKEGANYMMVVMGSADMHKSNSTVAAAVMGTLEAWQRDGRLTAEQLASLGDLVRETGANMTPVDPGPTGNKVKKVAYADAMRIKRFLEGFPGFEDPAAMHAYLDAGAFEHRMRVSEVMATKQAQASGRAADEFDP